MVYFSVASTADDMPSARLGKIRGVNLPVEYKLEKLIKGIQNPHSSWSTSTPACEWDGVDCNDEDEVDCINWTNRGLRGTLDWKHIPETVRSGYVRINKIEGTLELSALPRGLEKFWAEDNKLYGPLQFSDLPPSLKILNLSDNNFVGNVDFSNLPSELTGLNISNNKHLSGTLCLKNIPSTLAYRNVACTKITEVATIL